MKTREDIVQTLGDLAPADRTWVIERLSPATRAALLDDRVSHTTNAGTKNPASTSNHRNTAATLGSNATGKVADALNIAGASQIASALSNEPAWVAHALLTDQALLTAMSPRTDELRQLLPSALRRQIETLDMTGVRYSQALIDMVKTTLASALDGIATETSDVPRSWFDAVRARVGERFARQRMRMRA